MSKNDTYCLWPKYYLLFTSLKSDPLPSAVILPWTADLEPSMVLAFKRVTTISVVILKSTTLS